MGFWKNVCCNVATRYALTTPTPVLYMESLAGAAKGNVKAADGEAGEKMKKEKEAPQKQPYTRNEVLQQRLQQRTGLAGPVMPRPNGLARLQQRACAPLLRATKATGLRARLGGRAARIFVDCGGGCNVGIKMVAWPRVGFARAKLSMVLGFQHGQPQCQ